jgi:uncharacterized protein YndB with AHSA1/START domain
MIKADLIAEPRPTLSRRRLAAGEARVAHFTRTYDAPIDDVWDACTNPQRLARWYVPVTGDLRVGGSFQQAMMGSGEVVRCEAPSLLVVSLGGGKDELVLRLSESDEGTVLELEHATTLDQHEIGGQLFDAIFCMGGGYYPRLVALGSYLRGELPESYDPLTFHQLPELRPVIARGSQAMQELLDEDASR